MARKKRANYSKKQARFSNEDRARIVVESYETGATDTARRYSVSLSTIKKWRQRFPAPGRPPPTSRPLPPRSQNAPVVPEPPPDGREMAGMEQEIEGLLFRGWSESRITNRVAQTHGVKKAIVVGAIEQVNARMLAEGAKREALDVPRLKGEHRARYAAIFEVAFRLGSVGRAAVEGGLKARGPDPRYLRVALTAIDRLAELDGLRDPNAGSAVEVHVHQRLMQDNPDFGAMVARVLVEDGGYIPTDAKVIESLPEPTRRAVEEQQEERAS